MPVPGPLACSPLEAPLARGTDVALDPLVTFYDRELVAGGAPWRLLRLAGESSSIVQQWRAGGHVQAGQEQFARTLVSQGFLYPSYPTNLSKSELDVVIPVYGDAAGLVRQLEALRTFSVTVVDDGSPNERQIAEIAARFGATVVRLPTNAGPAVARNRGLQATTQPFVWFVDVDVVLDDTDDAARFLHSHFGDPMVAAVAPRVVGALGASALQRFESRHGALDMGPHSALVVPRARVAYVPSACLMVRRLALGDGFDESLRTGEDVDLVWRLHDRGWLVRYDATVVVRHEARTSLSAWWRQRHGYGRSASELAERHPNRLDPVRVDAWTLAAWAALLARQPRAAAAVTALARRSVEEQLPSSVADPGAVANAIAVRGIATAGGPLARAAVRSYGPVLLLAALHPKLRRPALSVFAAGTAWRWHDRRDFALSDVPVAMADDAAYATGVWLGAWKKRSLRAITPRVTGSTAGLRAALQQRTKSPPNA